MEQRTMTIHAALGEIKKLKQRIEKGTNNAVFIGNMKKSADTVNNYAHNKDEFKEIVTANHKSLEDLIKNLYLLKSKVTLSNALTMVTVGKESMTVAEAISRKELIEFEGDLLRRMKSQYDRVVAETTRRNEDVEDNLNDQVTALAGKDPKAKDNLAGFMEQYRNNNSWENVDPLNLKEKIDVLEQRIFDFETNVDVALSVSNATTFIEI